MIAAETFLALHPQPEWPDYSLTSPLFAISYLREDSPGIYSAIAHGGEVIGQLEVPSGIGRACIGEAFNLTIVKAGSPQHLMLAKTEALLAEQRHSTRDARMTPVRRVSTSQQSGVLGPLRIIHRGDAPLGGPTG